MNINERSVIGFIRKMNEAERIFAQNVLTMSKNLHSLEQYFGKETMAQKFSMTVKRWQSFKKGDNYSIRQVSIMSAAIMEQQIESAKEDAGVKFPDYKHSQK